MAGPRIRPFEERDIDRAIALTDLEGWGYTRADFLRLLALEPRGCLAAEADGSVVGVLTTTTYGPLAFLGAVIVQPERRGEGIGGSMMNAALEYLEAVGVETVRLNAYVHVVPFYERLGFRKEFENVRWQGRPMNSVTSAARPLRASELEVLATFDEAYFGGSRHRLLSYLAREFPDSFLVAEREGRLAGYLVGNTSGPACEIGPWVVDPGHLEAASDLFHGLMASTEARSYAFTVPVRNPHAGDFARRLGYEEVFRTFRMVRGTPGHPGKPEGVWGLAGLEKG